MEKCFFQIRCTILRAEFYKKISWKISIQLWNSTKMVQLNFAVLSKYRRRNCQEILRRFVVSYSEETTSTHILIRKGTRCILHAKVLFKGGVQNIPIIEVRHCEIPLDLVLLCLAGEEKPKQQTGSCDWTPFNSESVLELVHSTCKDARTVLRWSIWWCFFDSRDLWKLECKFGMMAKKAKPLLWWLSKIEIVFFCFWSKIQMHSAVKQLW